MFHTRGNNKLMAGSRTGRNLFTWWAQHLLSQLIRVGTDSRDYRHCRSAGKNMERKGGGGGEIWQCGLLQVTCFSASGNPSPVHSPGGTLPQDIQDTYTRDIPSLSRFAHTLESRKKILMQPHFKKLTNTAQYFKATFLKDDWKTFGGHDNSKAFYH